MISDIDKQILGAARLDRRAREYLALELGLSVPVMLQRMLKLATTPEAQAACPAECRMILDRRDRMRDARSGARLDQR